MIPFLLFEMNFDPDLFQRHYGSINSPGIYAIPEDETEPSELQKDDQFQSTTSVQDTEIEKNLSDKTKIEQNLIQSPGLPLPQLTADEKQAYDRETEPIKKIFLLNKLYELSYLLKNKFSIDSDLDLILRFGANLSYGTLQLLSINVVNQLKDFAKKQEINNGENNVQATI